MTSPPTNREPSGGYTEVLRPPASWWTGGGAFCLAVWWAFFVATTAVVALCAAAVSAAVVLALLAGYGGARVAIDDAGLRAGRASLPWRYVGPATACDTAETKRLLGAGADARAYLLIRPYLPTAVQIVVHDERDPAPYWLISTRSPAEVAARLNTVSVPD